VNEDILRTVGGGDEPEPLVTEKLNGPLERHGMVIVSAFSNGGFLLLFEGVLIPSYASNNSSNNGI
jgi:hypothetical protein